MEQKRIGWIDGLRGLACVFIVLHHFIMGYYPAAFYGAGGASHTASGIDAAFAQSPLGFFVNGDTWVTVFCLVSGFVIANQVWRMTEDRQLSKALLKRYPRLMLPVFAVSAIVFVMLRLNLFCNLQASYITQSEWLGMFYQDKSGLGELLLDSLVDNWLVGLRLVYSNAFWMLNALFSGSFLAYILAFMGKGRQKRMLWVYLFASAMYMSVNSHMADFALGVLAAFLLSGYGKLFREKKGVFLPVGILLVIIGFFLGAYPTPTELTLTNGYRYLAGIEGRLTAYAFYHKLAVFALIMGIGMLSFLQKLLDTAPCLFLGKISYAVYLVHIPVLFSLTAWIFMRLDQRMGRYNLAAVTALCISLAVILVLAWLFWMFVERYCVKFTDWLAEKILN